MKRLLFILLIPALLFGQMNLNNNTVQISAGGDIKFNFAHSVGYADSIAYTIDLGGQWVWKKINTTALTWLESDFITGAGDSVTVSSFAGDYELKGTISMSGTNAGDFWRLAPFKNNALIPAHRFRFNTKANNVTDTKTFIFYLKDLALNDVISLCIRNESADRDPTITHIWWELEKKPE